MFSAAFLPIIRCS